MADVKRVNVVFIPWYVKTALDAFKIDLELLEIKLDYWEDDYLMIDCRKNAVAERLSVLSTIDLDALLTANEVFPVKLGTSVFGDEHYTSGVGGKDFINPSRFPDKEIKEEFFNTLMDENISTDKPYELVIGVNTTFVITNKGFSNFIYFKDKEKINSFYRDLLKFMFEHFQEEQVFSTGYFKRFLNLKLNNK